MSLLPQTEALMAQVEVLSGKAVELVPDPKLTVPSTVSFAETWGGPFHVITYNREKAILNYHVAWQCAFLIRVFQVPPAERFHLATTEDGPKAVERQLRSQQAASRFPGPLLSMAAAQMYRGLLVQLRSYPVGMRIDQWLYDEYPELRPDQKTALARQHRDNLEALSPQVRALSPPSVYKGNVSMNAAFALFSDRLLGSPEFAVPYRAAGHLRTAEQLLSVFDGTPAEAASDRDLIAKWADELGIADWYRWVPLTEVS